MTLPQGALDGLRVIDMTTVVMGPYATQILGDFGADVIKVEAPAGDTTRHVTPMRSPAMGWVFLHVNRNKRSLVLDLKQPDGRQALLRLIATSDVLVSNVRPQALARLGLGQAALQAANPRLINLSLVGYGARGNYAGRPVYEDLIQGLTAMPSLLVEAGSETPHYVPLAYNDRGVGLNAAIAILAAVIRRERSGVGQHIEIPMFETMTQAVLGDHMGGLTFDPPLGPPGYKRTLNKERRPYPTQDGFICVIIYTDKHWHSYMKLIGAERQFLQDPRFADIGTRTEHAHALYGFLSDAMATKTTAEWLQILIAADIPATPLHTLESLVDDPHLNAAGFFNIVEHPSEGRIREMAVPSTWSESPPAIRRRAPRLGEQSVEILREAGLPEDMIARMLNSGAAVQATTLPAATSGQEG